jgi:predicted MPP superfamily phosphohydrolase
MTLDPEWAARRRAIERSRYWVGPNGRRGRWRKAITSKVLALGGLGLRLFGLYGRGRRNALAVRCVEMEIDIPGLPATFDGYRLLHLSDTHLDVLPELAAVARQLLAGLDVDMLALTGDVHGHPSVPISRSVGLLGEALREVRVHGPRIAILGNHDGVEMATALRELGFDVLINRSRVLERGGERLRITGLDDVHQFYTEAAPAALDEHGDEVRIALVHSAELADVADRAGYALYLCGHTHGGQICLPGGRPVVTQLTRCRHAAAGLWREGRMTGYTNSGLGVAPPTVRFNSRGEVAVITLRRVMVGAVGIEPTTPPV